MPFEPRSAFKIAQPESINPLRTLNLTPPAGSRWDGERGSNGMPILHGNQGYSVDFATSRRQITTGSAELLLFSSRPACSAVVPEPPSTYQTDSRRPLTSFPVSGTGGWGVRSGLSWSKLYCAAQMAASCRSWGSGSTTTCHRRSWLTGCPANSFDSESLIPRAWHGALPTTMRGAAGRRARCPVESIFLARRHWRETATHR